MKKETSKSVILLLIVTIIMTGVWIGIEVYKAYTRVGAPADMEKYLTPLTPTLKTEVLDTLENKTP